MKEFTGVNLSKNENVEDVEDTSQTMNWLGDISTDGILHWATEEYKEVMMEFLG
jgi:hypothetical protein